VRNVGDRTTRASVVTPLRFGIGIPDTFTGTSEPACRVAIEFSPYCPRSPEMKASIYDTLPFGMRLKCIPLRSATTSSSAISRSLPGSERYRPFYALPPALVLISSPVAWNHREVIVAMDFFTVATATFGVLYGWFAIRHFRREVVHWSVTESPTAPWVVQQLREAFPFDTAGVSSRYLVFDRDTIFSAEVVAAVSAMTLEPMRTSYQSPWQNGVAERFVGTVRREPLDHAIVLDDEHLRRLLREDLANYHDALARPVERRRWALA
jgi:transposase InsO family protein